MWASSVCDYVTKLSIFDKHQLSLSSTELILTLLTLYQLLRRRHVCSRKMCAKKTPENLIDGWRAAAAAAAAAASGDGQEAPGYDWFACDTASLKPCRQDEMRYQRQTASAVVHAWCMEWSRSTAFDQLPAGSHAARLAKIFVLCLSASAWQISK